MTKEEVAKLLKDSNEEDYNKVRKTLNEKFKGTIPDDAPIYYTACKYNGFDAVGHKLSALVEYEDKVFAAIFDTVTWIR